MKEVFHAALERGVEERMAFVARVCDADEALRVDVERLLTAHVTLRASPVASIASDSPKNARRRPLYGGRPFPPTLAEFRASPPRLPTGRHR